MALALTSLCFLAMITVRLRNNETLLGYRIAELERMERQLDDHLMAQRAEMARRTTAHFLLARAAELGIRLQLEGFEDVLVELIQVPDEERPGEGAVEDAFHE
jgi:hypothetical protein